MKRITIYLGSKCNLNCTYCHKEKSDNEQSLSDSFIKELSINKGKDLYIKFMGGEPTLYMNDIRRVVESCPLAKYAISTNGTTLKENIDFFRTHNFLLVISYDGNDNSVRGFDPLTELIDYPRLAISCTLYHNNTNFKEIIANFSEKEKIIGKELLFFPHIVHHTNETNKQYALDFNDIYNIITQYKNSIEIFIHDFKLGVINRRYIGIVIQLLRRYDYHFEYGETYCVNKILTKRDNTGQIYSCQYIRDEKLSENNLIEDQAKIISSKFPKCKECEVYGMCGSACIKSISHDIECFFYNNLYTWFKQYYSENKEIFERLRSLKIYEY